MNSVTVRKSTCCLSILVLILATGCGKEAIQPAQVTSPKSSAETVAPPAEASTQSSPAKEQPKAKTADYKTTVADLEKEFKQDKAKADEKYRNKTVELTGKVVKVWPDGFSYQIDIASPDAAFLQCSKCVFPDNNLIGKIGRGQTVRLVGQYKETNNVGGAFFDPCEIVDLGDNTLLKIDAGDLAHEFATDSDKATARIRDKTLLVSGVIEGVKQGDIPAWKNVSIKNSDGIIILCRFSNLIGLETEYKVGQSVNFITDDPLVYGDKTLTLKSCAMVAK